MGIVVKSVKTIWLMLISCHLGTIIKGKIRLSLCHKLITDSACFCVCAQSGK